MNQITARCCKVYSLSYLKLDVHPILCAFEFYHTAPLEHGFSQMGEDYPPAAELVPMFEEGEEIEMVSCFPPVLEGLADEEVGPFGDNWEKVVPFRVSRVGYHPAAAFDAQRQGIRHARMCRRVCGGPGMSDLERFSRRDHPELGPENRAWAFRTREDQR